jgi:hypothetical protein
METVLPLGGGTVAHLAERLARPLRGGFSGPDFIQGALRLQLARDPGLAADSDFLGGDRRATMATRDLQPVRAVCSFPPALRGHVARPSFEPAVAAPA